MRGFAITLDALLALSMFSIMLAVVSQQAYAPSSPGTIYLKELTLDTMTVLEKTGAAESALSGNASRMDSLLEATPEQACIRLSMINASGAQILSLYRDDCTDDEGQDLQVAVRPVFRLGQGYIMRAESWLKKAE